MADAILRRIERGPDREVRIARSEYKGRAYFHVREWLLLNGAWIPGKGIALRESELAQVASALDVAAGISSETNLEEVFP